MENREPKEKAHSIHNKLGFTRDRSPKWENHKFSTPKNKIRMAKNPFEPLLHDVMHTNIMSPSVFAAIPNKAPVADGKFCWSIEELATLKPIDIEKSPFVQSDATDHVMEAVAQAKINKFFSAKTILPSPAGPSVTSISKSRISSTTPTSASPLASTPSPPLAISTPSDSVGQLTLHPNYQQQKRCKLRTTGSQTYLSLPAVLPAAVEKVLNQYMQADGMLMGELYPNGFDSSEEEAHNCSPKAMQDLSPLAESPLHKPLHDSLYNERQAKDNWQLSPIAALDDENSGSSERFMRSRRSVAKLDFSAGHMSVDLSSQQLAAGGDELDGLEFHNNSLRLHLGNTPPPKNPNYYARSPSLSPLQQLHNTSAPNSSFSRMEDDYVTFHRSRSIEMDISFSNTPKSRSTSATRRRLCDSFASFGDEDDDDEQEADADEKEDTVEERGSPKKYMAADNLTSRNHELTDTGYSTASTFEESSLCFEKNTNLFASTPTKTKSLFFPVNE